MDIDDTADQLLNNIQLQISIEHIPFESIRSNQTVISALQNLVTRAYFDRNYSKQDTRNKIDSLIIAILNALKSPVVDLTADTEDESANPEQQPDLAAGPSSAAASESQDNQEPVQQDNQEPGQEPPRKRQRQEFFRSGGGRFLGPASLDYSDDSSISDVDENLYLP